MALHLISEDYELEIRDDELGLDDGDPTVVYTVKPVTRALYRSVVAGHTKKRPNPRTRQMEDVVDNVAASEDLLDAILVKWTGVMFNGEPAPCNREMKLTLDPPRAAALMDKAGRGQVVEEGSAKAQSFRRTR